MTRIAQVPAEGVAGGCGEVDDAVARLDRQLAARRERARVGLTIAARHREDVERLARRHGYDLQLALVEEPGCLWAEFRPVEGS